METKGIKFIEREMTKDEYALMTKGFDSHMSKFGNPPLRQKRYTVIITDSNKYIGSASGLTNDNKEWFFLTDLFIDEKYRKQGLGSKLLNKLEKKIAKKGVKHIWTWTSEFEAPKFYKKQGYRVFTKMNNWYKSGHGRIGLSKDL